jgi:hypothetical protein
MCDKFETDDTVHRSSYTATSAASSAMLLKQFTWSAHASAKQRAHEPYGHEPISFQQDGTEPH